jgi:transposase
MWIRTTPNLWSPDRREWVPAEHLVDFVINAVEQLNLSAARVNDRGSGSKQYPPGMMLALLFAGARNALAARSVASISVG